jgi:ABC-2 type transport system permease protein
MVLTGKRPVALVLPAGFGADVIPGLFDTNRKPVLTLLHDPSRGMEKSMVEGLLVPKVLQSVLQHGIGAEWGRDSLRRGLTNLDRAGKLSAGDRQKLRDLMVRADEFLATRTNRSSVGSGTGANDVRTPGGFTLPSPYVTRSEPLMRSATKEYNGYAHSFAGMGLQFVLMSMLDLAVGLLRDREAGVFRRLRSAPLARGTMLLGKGMSLSLISLLSLGGCFAFAMIVFKVRIEGSWPGFVACLLSTSVMSASLGLAIAALGRTPSGTRGIGIAVILLLVMVGGAWVPAFIFPQWLQRVSLLTPTRWAVDGFDAMTWRGLGLDAALVPVGLLLGFTVAFAAITWFRFRWDAE